jgi:hypothetical protein
MRIAFDVVKTRSTRFHWDLDVGLLREGTSSIRRGSPCSTPRVDLSTGWCATTPDQMKMSP